MGLLRIPLIAASESLRPTRAHERDAGMDLRSRVELVLAPGERALCPVGIRVDIPSGHAGLVLPRSGIAVHRGMTVLNAPGCIDPGYRDEVAVLLINHGDAPVDVAVGDRVAQLIVVPVVEVLWELVDELPGRSDRRGGFGSSGR